MMKPEKLLMKDIDDLDKSEETSRDADQGVPLDPTSISLFSNNVDTAVPTLNNNNNGLASTGVNNAIDFGNFTSKETTKDGSLAQASTSARVSGTDSVGEKRKNATSYSNYAHGKATEVTKRRNLNERIEKLKSNHGIIFNVPQCQEITLNQLAIFLRRLRKSPDVRSIMSMELMAKVFQEEQHPSKKEGGENERRLSNVASALVNGQRDYLASAYGSHHQPKQSGSNYQAVISVNDLFGEDEDMPPSAPSTSTYSQSMRGDEPLLRDGEDDSTETSSTCSEDDDYDENICFDQPPDNGKITDSDGEMPKSMEKSPNNRKKISVDDYEFYKRRMEILSADLRAVTFYRRVVEVQENISKTGLYSEVKFADAPQTGNEEEDSQTCARCRPLSHRPERPLIFANHLERRNRAPTTLKPNLRCGTVEYSAVDDSIHPLLSLDSAIPMERKMQKYLHVSGTLAPEVEKRRQKTAELAFKKSAHRSTRNLFYFADELSVPEEQHSKTSPTPISLTLKKRLINTTDASSTTASSDTAQGSGSGGGGRNRYTNKHKHYLNHDGDDEEDEDEEDVATEDSDEYPPLNPRVSTRRRHTHYQAPKRMSLNLRNKPYATAAEIAARKVVAGDKRRLMISAKKLRMKRVINDENWASHHRFDVKRPDFRRSDSRRSSIHSTFGREEFGSIFDFDASFTDIGLTAVQNVENKEIAIPQYRRKDVFDNSVIKPCDCCALFTDADPFAKIRQLHEVLEAQEKQRFKVCRGTRLRP